MSTRVSTDVNECKIPGICSQVCYNTKGSFKCICRVGYNLEPDRRSCKAIGKYTAIIFLLESQTQPYACKNIFYLQNYDKIFFKGLIQGFQQY